MKSKVDLAVDVRIILIILIYKKMTNVIDALSSFLNVNLNSIIINVIPLSNSKYITLYKKSPAF